MKKLLFTLIAVLVFIVGAGGAYLAATGMLSNLTGQHGTTSQSASTQVIEPNQKNEQNTNNQQQPPAQDNQSQMNMPENNGQSTQNHNQAQVPGQAQTGGQQNPTQSPANQTQPPVQTLPPAPPIKVINPEPYYDKLTQAQAIIDEANKMITVDPFTTDSKDGSMSAPDMAKLHQGIYKMSQGVTAMKETLDTLNGEIKGQTQFGVDPYQQYRNQVNSGYSYAIPYNPYGAPNYSYPQNYNNPQGNGTNQAPVQQGQQGTQNSNSQSATMPGMNQSGTTDTSSAHGSQQVPDQANQHLQSGNQVSGATQTGNVDSTNIIRYALYGVLVVSLIAVFASIAGILKGLFKPATNEQAGGVANV